MPCRLCLFPMIALLSLATAHPVVAERPDVRSTPRTDDTSSVRLVKENGAYHLERAGKLYFIKGAGGDGSRTLLRDVGGNSIRTWGADNLGAVLDEAQRLGLTVTAGIWLGHREHGFDYNNATQVAGQYESARKTILRYKDHPALLMWALGNEMEGYEKGDDPKIWAAVNEIAAMAKRIDSYHPTMTVIAEIGGQRVQSINRLCPAIDIIGINSYGGGPTLAQRYRAAGGVKPYVITEYGPPGVWETGKNDWGAAVELTSTAKAECYRKTYQDSIAEQPLCLGGYAFTWGHKQEATATWFGMLLSDGSRLDAVDALQTRWTGEAPTHSCPILRSLKVEGPEQVDPGATVHASLDMAASDGGVLNVRWVLQSDTQRVNTNGDAEAAPRSFADSVIKADRTGVNVKMPDAPGGYRLFAYVSDAYGGAAVANVPLLVRLNVTGGKAVRLPVVVYDEGANTAGPYVASGYMGNTAAIRMNPDWADRPHAGRTCLQVRYASGGNWGGVVWQSPANDWGHRSGGLNLTGATRLAFWARGERGGESVTFLCGAIGHDKPYYDTAQAKLEKVSLSTEWKQYTIDLKGRDLTRIKTAFGWVVAATGVPITFYLDDIRFE